MKISTNKGFSLIEILLVITLLSILFAILLTRVNPRNIIYMTEDNQKESDALTIYQALEQYAIKNNTYPDSIKNMPNNSSAHICKTTATSCNSNTNTQINLSSILVPTYMSKIPEYSTDTNNSGFYVVRDSNGKIGIGGVKQINNITFVKGLESQSFATIPIPPIVSNGLVLHLDAGNASSYPGTGTTWNDLSGNGNNGTFLPSVGGPTYSSINGGSLVFDGVNDYGSISNSSSLRPPTELTVSMWAKANSYTAGWNRLLGQSPHQGGGYLIFLETGGQLIRALHYPNGSEVRCNTGYSISTTQFTHITFTFKMGDAIRSYFNGVASTTVALSSGTFSYNTSNPFLFGHNGANWFNGNISQISIYNRALTVAEIQQNFNATKGIYGL